MSKDLDTVEYEVQLKLKEFLESQGVNTLLLWNEIENFVGLRTKKQEICTGAVSMIEANSVVIAWNADYNIWEW